MTLEEAKRLIYRIHQVCERKPQLIDNRDGTYSVTCAQKRQLVCNDVHCKFFNDTSCPRDINEIPSTPQKLYP
jgi:hypothetical protein